MTICPDGLWRLGFGIRLSTERLCCEVAARISSRLHRAVKVDVFSDLSLFGVRLSFFRTFVKRCGEEAALEKLTTCEVMEQFVKPQTKASQLSLCEQLISDGGDGAAFVETAKVFLSHAWKYLFLDLVASVERRFRGSADPDPVVWFDVFSVSQHKAGERNFAWWNNTFLNAVGNMGEVVMVMQPWRAPIPLTRAWCIFEAYSAEATSSRFSIAMSDADAKDLVKQICENPSALFATLRRVYCEACTATNLEDRDRIFDTVRQSVGFAQLDSMVAFMMVEAVCAELLIQADTARDAEDLAGAACLLQALAQLRGLQRNYAEAERLHRECLATAGLVSADIHTHASLGIARACTRQGKHAEAMEAYRSVLQAVFLCHDDPVSMEAASGLALECFAVAEMHDEADLLAVEWKDACAKGKCSPALRNFGQLRLAQGRMVDAEDLFRAGLDALREQWGEWSPLLP